LLRRIVIGLVGTVIVLAVLVGGAYYAITLWFNPSPPAKDYPKAANALTAQRQDLDYFRKLVALDQSYAPADRARADRALDKLGASSTVLDWGSLRTTLMGIAAMADNGHTAVFSGDNRRPNAVPLRVYGFPDGLYVLRAKAGNADLLGSRVEAIDGQPTERVLAKLDALRGGIAAFRRTSSQIWVQSPEILHGLGIAPAPDRTVWTFRLPSGERVTRMFRGEALTKDETLEAGIRWLSPEALEKEAKDWRAMWPAKLPLTLREFNRTFRREPIADSCTLFLQMKLITDGPHQKIDDWLAQTEDAMAAHKPCAVILDLRFNGGGDYTNTWAFAHQMPHLMRPGARLLILTGPDTFSAAITTVAFLKETLGDRAVILGEPIGDRLKFLSEGNSGCLPNSGICFHYSTGMHDYGARCTDWRVCYWLNWLYPVRVKSLAPDERIGETFSDWRSGHDPVFERALALSATSR
jgi:hypothetical protein